MGVAELVLILKEFFAALRGLAELGYTAGVIVYFIAVIVVLMYIHYKFNDEGWLYKD